MDEAERDPEDPRGLSAMDDADEVARLRARVAELEAAQPAEAPTGAPGGQEHHAGLRRPAS